MRRFPKCGISRWLVVLLITIFATGDSFAEKIGSDTFASAYNRILSEIKAGREASEIQGKCDPDAKSYLTLDKSKAPVSSESVSLTVYNISSVNQ